MARVHFTVHRRLPISARLAFDELVDWKGHAEWVPMTRVVMEAGDGSAGTVFVATTGLGPLALPDRMRVESIDAERMAVTVTKIGPILTGTVRLEVAASTDDACTVLWDEDIRVPLLPGFLSNVVGAAARKAFEVSIDRMATYAARRAPQRRVESA